MYLYPYSPHALECNLQSKHPQYPLNGNFDGIYVRDAVIFREAENKGYELLQNPFNMSFISVPAIREPILNDGMLNKRDIIIAKDKIRTILRLGLINSHDALVLGAWGCGIFHNPPRDIARLFKEVFLEEEFFNKYKKVVFAILDDSISLVERKMTEDVLPVLKNYLTMLEHIHAQLSHHIDKEALHAHDGGRERVKGKVHVGRQRPA